MVTNGASRGNRKPHGWAGLARKMRIRTQQSAPDGRGRHGAARASSTSSCTELPRNRAPFCLPWRPLVASWSRSDARRMRPRQVRRGEPGERSSERGRDGAADARPARSGATIGRAADASRWSHRPTGGPAPGTSDPRGRPGGGSAYWACVAACCRTISSVVGGTCASRKAAIASSSRRISRHTRAVS